MFFKCPAQEYQSKCSIINKMVEDVLEAQRTLPQGRNSLPGLGCRTNNNEWKSWGSHSSGYECCYFRDIVPCSPCVNWHFWGTYHLNLQVENQLSKISVCNWCLGANTLLSYLVDFRPWRWRWYALWNMGSHMDYMALYPTKQQHHNE
jgi:hypothetical protein